MIEGDKYPEIFLDRLLQLVKLKHSIFLPVRLECDEDELIWRVKKPERRDLFKTIDAERAIDLSRNKKVFFSNHPNEITINNTHQSPEQIASLIISQLNKLIVEKS